MNTTDDINSKKLPNTEISSINFTKDLFSVIYKSPTKLTLMYSDKCPFCRKIRPIWNDLRDVYENKYIFDVVDCDYEKERASKYDFRALPTIFKNDYINPISKSEGFMEYNNLEEFITKKPIKPKKDNYRIDPFIELISDISDLTGLKPLLLAKDPEDKYLLTLKNKLSSSLPSLSSEANFLQVQELISNSRFLVSGRYHHLKFAE